MSDPQETLARIRAQADAATPGPWEHEPPPGPGEDPMRPICVYPKEDGGTLAYVQPLEADAEFIATSRTTVPALLDLAESVLDRHRKSDYTRLIGFPRADAEEYYCMEDQKSYPCPTVTDITRELERHHG